MIRTISVEQRDEWNDAVRRLPDYEAFYLNEYMRAFALTGSGEPVLAVYCHGDDYGINAFFRRDIAEDPRFARTLERGRYYDITSPYGYGGFMGRITHREQLLDAWNTHCRENGYVCGFVRFSLFSDYRTYFDGETESRTRNVVRNLVPTPEEIWMDFKPKVRKNVKRANACGLKIVRDPDGTYLEDFLRIYYGTMERVNAAPHFFFPRSFFQTLNEMKDNVMYFHAVHGDKIISTELVLVGGENCYSFLGGTDSAYFEMRPNDLLKYEIILWARKKGMKNFVLGGGYGADDGIFQYKSCLAPNGICDFWIGKKIWDAPVYEELCRTVGADMSTQFFPAYRSV